MRNKVNQAHWLGKEGVRQRRLTEQLVACAPRVAVCDMPDSECQLEAPNGVPSDSARPTHLVPSLSVQGVTEAASTKAAKRQLALCTRDRPALRTFDDLAIPSFASYDEFESPASDFGRRPEDLHVASASQLDFGRSEQDLRRSPVTD